VGTWSDSIFTNLYLFVYSFASSQGQKEKKRKKAMIFKQVTFLKKMGAYKTAIRRVRLRLGLTKERYLTVSS
jgi:hypothetical protein